MKNLENILNNIKVPQLDSDPFEAELRRKLKNKYFNQPAKLKLRLILASVLGTVLFIFSIALILNPRIAVEINQFAFNKTDHANTIDSEELDRLMAEQLNEKFKYTSIYNPELTDKLDPRDFKEDKAYLIRKYTSSSQGSVMMISEFDNKPTNNNRKISY
jgi:hypothetical protein